MSGTVDLVDGCLVVRPEGGVDPVVPVFVDRVVTWDGEALTFQAERYELGAGISFGGGSAGTVADAPASLDVPDECAADWDVWLVGGLHG